MYCSKCGNKIEDSSKFCPECGEKQAVLAFKTENKIFSLFKKFKESKQKILIVLYIGIVGLTILTILISRISYKESPSYSYYDSPSYLRNTFESCHSTAEHIQAIYSYDLNNDNKLSKYELELFVDAHPKLINDKQFIQWLEEQ